MPQFCAGSSTLRLNPSRTRLFGACDSWLQICMPEVAGLRRRSAKPHSFGLPAWPTPQSVYYLLTCKFLIATLPARAQRVLSCNHALLAGTVAAKRRLPLSIKNWRTETAASPLATELPQAKSRMLTGTLAA